MTQTAATPASAADVFATDTSVQVSAITDGTSYTIAVIEDAGRIAPQQRYGEPVLHPVRLHRVADRAPPSRETLPIPAAARAAAACGVGRIPTRAAAAFPAHPTPSDWPEQQAFTPAM